MSRRGPPRRRNQIPDVNKKGTSQSGGCPSAALQSSFSLHFYSLSPLQAFLLDHYISRFVPTYFSCRTADMPFLSIIVPLAMRSSTVLSALIALSGIQTGRRGSPEIKIETLKANQATLKGCKQLLASLTRENQQLHVPDPQPPEQMNKENRLDHEDLLMLLASALLLMLYEQVTDATYSTIRPHLKFAFWLSNILDHAKPAMSGSIAAHHAFLRSILLYDDLIASISARRPPLVGYSTYLYIMQAPASSEEINKYYLPLILNRITCNDHSVRMEDIDQWDGRMDWLPSFFTPTRQSLDGESNRFCDRDTAVISKIYPAASKIFFYQMSCKGLCKTAHWSNHNAEPHICLMTKGGGNVNVPSSSDTKDTIAELMHDAISFLRELDEGSKFQGALLWPIGIIAQEVGSDDLATQIYILEILGRLENNYGMTHFSRYKSNLALMWSKNSVDSGVYEEVHEEGTSLIGMNGEILFG